MKYQRCKIFVFDLIAVFGFFLTALGTYLTIMSDKTVELIHSRLLICFGIGCIVTAVGWYYYFHLYHLLVSVLEGRDNMAEVHTMIQEYQSVPMTKSRVQLHLNYLSEICQCISTAFHKYHSPDISVCIHYINKDDKDKYYVKILSRNTDSKRRPQQSPPPGGEVDYIDDNTDFKTLIEIIKHKSPGRVYYLNNFLPWSPGYRNSHFSEKMSKKYFSWKGIYYRVMEWELPYKSTLVIPIMTLSDKKRKISGFLAVDSPKMWAFSSVYDLPALISVAKSLAPYIDSYNRLNLTLNSKGANG